MQIINKKRNTVKNSVTNSLLFIWFKCIKTKKCKNKQIV